MDDGAWQRVKELFHDAVGVPSEQRRALLEQRCQDHPELVDEVMALLAAHDQDDADAPTPGAPDRIGRYRVLRSLGEGGFGTVHLAEQSEPVHRMVALKILRAGMDTAQVIERFRLERESLARMSHPNIAQIYDAGTTAAGLPFFAMEFVDGASLTTFCDEHRLGVAQRLQLFVPVCRAVHHAHQKGIIHRDLKPSNVLVVAVDGAPVPKIIDFGIAKATQGLGDAGEFRTLEGRCLGTPGYMSPEQADLDGGQIDVRSDIYSLGVLLYELLTGRLPHDPSQQREGGLLGYLQQVREREPRRPSTTVTGQDAAFADARRATAAGLRHRLRGDLDWIALRALERDPNRRYQSADDIAEDLERHLRHEPVLAGPPGMGYRLRKFVRRHRVVAASSAAVLLALVFGLAAALWQFQIARAALRDAVGHRLSAQAINLAAENPTQALLLAIEGAERAPGEDADAALYATLGLAHEVRREVLHDATARWAAYSADETCSLSADDTQLVRCLDLPGGTIRHTFDLHDATMSGLAVDASGDRGASFDLTGLLLLLDLRAGRELARVPHPQQVPAAVFAGDDHALFTICHDGALRRIDGAGRIEELARHDQRLLGMAVDHAAARVAVLRADSVVVVHALPSGRELTRREIAAPAAQRRATTPPQLAFTDSGRWLVCLDARGAVEVVDTTAPNESWRPCDLPCTAIALAGAAEQLALFTEPPQHRVVDLRTRAAVRLEIAGAQQSVAGVAIDPRAYTLVAVLRNRPLLCVLDPASGGQLATLRGDNHALYSPFVSADGEWIDAYGHNGAVHRWRTAVLGEDRRPAQRLARGDTTRVVPVPPGDQVVEHGADGRVVLRDLRDRSAPRPLAAGVRQGAELVLSPRNDALLVCLPDATAVVRLADGATLRRVPTPLRHPRCNDALTHLVGLRGSTVLCFDLRTGAKVHEHTAAGTQYCDVDRDGTRLVTADGGRNRTTLWSLASGESILEIPHRAFAFDARFTADGTGVLTLANDLSALLVDASTGRTRLQMRAPTSDFGWLHRDAAGRYVAVQTPEETSIYSLTDGQRRLRWAPGEVGKALVAMQFSTDGEELLVRLDNGCLRRLPLDPLRAARAAAPRALTAAERTRFELPPDAAPDAEAPPVTSSAYADAAVALLREDPDAAALARATALLEQARAQRPRMQPRYHLARALLQVRRPPPHLASLDDAARAQLFDDLRVSLQAGEITARTLTVSDAFAALRADPRGAEFIAAQAR